VPLRSEVHEALVRHGITPSSDDTPAGLRERLNDLYLDEVRRLRDRQRSGSIPLKEYSAHVEALKNQFPLLGLPLPRWEA
jgi:hypothetical protein